MKYYFTGKFRLGPRQPKHWWQRPMFDFYLDPVEPLEWHAGKEWSAQPDQHFPTDGGTIPKIVQIIPAFDAMRFPKSYPFHDSAYKNHCWYVRSKGGINCQKVTLSRVEADYWLYQMLKTEGAAELTAHIVYRAVRDLGWAIW